MADYVPVPVSVAKEVAERCDKQIIIILAWNRPSDMCHLTSYGESPTEKDTAAAFADKLRDMLADDPSAATVFEDFREPTEAAKTKAERDQFLACIKAIIDQTGDPEIHTLIEQMLNKSLK